MPDGDLTPREVAAELGVTVRTVQRWVASGALPAARVGGRVRVSRSSLSAFSAPVAGAAGAREAEPSTGRPIRSLFIANRGEIAVRIARTARAMGLRVIGVHAADERPQRGVDEVRQIGSYLDADELLRAAAATGADAVHPGYGFLAESPQFARKVNEAGLRWVGPPADAIGVMGDKAAARGRAASLGIPVVPGYEGDAQDDATLEREARRIGFPLLVKPSAGGGGKGMRVVTDPGALSEALAASRREAARSFGDDRLILERFLAGSRHVEVQLLFDAHGAGVHLGERDCSAQRRNQKIVEEAPAPGVGDELREHMADAALLLASSVGYAGAGTVEMLLTDADAYFFLEMNTRLQVEHPVTEAVTGRDLVADQIRIASGEPLAALGLSTPPRLRGHAIEARLYAEDPDAGFLPATGRIERLRWPEGVRIDSGLEEGDRVSESYDPMLAKIVAHAATRDEALERLREALGATTVLGVRTNLRFLRWLLDQPATRNAEIRTDTLARLTLPAAPEPADAAWSAAAAVLAGGDLDAGGRTAWEGGWRLNALPVLRLRQGGETRLVSVGGGAGVGGEAVAAGDVAHVDVEGQSLEFEVAPPPSVDAAASLAVVGGADAGARLVAPMPGRVAAIRAAAGARVQAREPVVILEAMKMEHAVVAPIEGTVARLLVAEGAQVQRGDLLAEVEPYHAEGD